MSRVSSRVVAALVVALSLAGCAAIPDSGPVRSAAAIDGDSPDAPRYVPSGPRDGATPEQVVRGYLDAMLAYPVDTAVAAQFLAPGSRRTWQPDDGTTVYSDPSFTPARSTVRAEVSSSQETVMEVDGTQLAALDARGRYEPGRKTLRKQLRLTRFGGQWRIINPPRGMLVTAKFFADYYRPYSLWFFDRPGRRLVPQVVHLVAGERLATSLATSLVDGPEDAPSLRTYVRPQDGLRPSVPVDSDGVADVELADDVTRRSRSDQDRLVAQLVRTLQQVPSTRVVRVSAGPTRLTPGGTGVGDASRFDPPQTSERVFAVVRDRLREVTTTGLPTVPGAWGKDSARVDSLVVGGSGIAATSLDGPGVRVTDRLGGHRRTVATAGRVLLTWDTAGLLWIVDRPAGRVRVRVVSGSRTTPVDVPLGTLDVTSFAISPDGGHYAVTDGVRGVRVGLVSRGTREDVVTRLLPARRVVASVDRPASVHWIDGTHVAFLARTQVGVQVHSAVIDGSDQPGGITGAEPLLPDVGATSLALGAGVDPPLWVVDGRGRLWYRPVGQSWLVSDRGPVQSLSSAP